MLEAFGGAYRGWARGTYLMWYPIRSATQRRLVHARFEALRVPKMLYADLAVHPDDAGVGLAGSGLMMVNPPFGADDFLRQAYEVIHGAVAAAGTGPAEGVRRTPPRGGQKLDATAGLP